MTETGVGDFILSTGVIREIRRLYPDARITLLVRAASFNLAETCPYVDEIITDIQGVLPLSLPEFYELNLQTAARLLEQRFDICFALALHPKTFLLMYMSGAKIRVTALKHEHWQAVEPTDLTAILMRLATDLAVKIPYGSNMADRFFSILEHVTRLPITNRKLEVWHTPADVAVAVSLLRRAEGNLYSLNMGGTNGKKHYPPEMYARLLELILHEEPTATFVILGGGQADLQSAAAMLRNVAPDIYANNVIDLTNKISYRQSAAVLSLCQTHIGNDTGTIHLAAAVGCPVLTPNCFAADLPIRHTDAPRVFCPYGVPSVVVQPRHMLTECKNLNFYDSSGCLANVPHCIAQIEPTTLLRGFHLLKERIAAKINEPLYIF